MRRDEEGRVGLNKVPAFLVFQVLLDVDVYIYIYIVCRRTIVRR
jgi:hypothetical protein